MKQIFFLILLSVMLVSGCTFNKAIRGGAAVDSYAISEINLLFGDANNAIKLSEKIHAFLGAYLPE